MNIIYRIDLGSRSPKPERKAEVGWVMGGRLDGSYGKDRSYGVHRVGVTGSKDTNALTLTLSPRRGNSLGRFCEITNGFGTRDHARVHGYNALLFKVWSL